MELHPETDTKIEYYEMTRMEKITEWWDRLKIIMHDPELSQHQLSFSRKRSKNFHWFTMFAGTCPMTYHMQMFTKCISDLGSEE